MAGLIRNSFFSDFQSFIARFLLPCLWVFILLLGLLSTNTTQAQAPGDTRLDQVLNAYDGLETYHARLVFEVVTVEGRWQQVRRGTFELAYDREAETLLIDNPDITILVTEQELRLKSAQFPGRYLALPFEEPITYDALLERIEVLSDPTLIDLIFLTDDDPISTLTGGLTSRTTPRASASNDPLKRPRMFAPTNEGELVFSMDPELNLITGAVFYFDMQTQGAPAGHDFNIKYSYEILAADQPIAEAVFNFDTVGLQRTESMQDYLNFGVGPGGGGGGPVHPLINQPAPDFESVMLDGKPVKFSDIEEDIIVLDFFATWCGPCQFTLPELVALRAWADEAGHSVYTAAVNMAETPKEVNPYLKRSGWEIPVIMDPAIDDFGNTEIAAKYQAFSLPTVFLIVEGTIVDVQIGWAPDYEGRIQELVEEHLERLAAKREAERAKKEEAEKEEAEKQEVEKSDAKDEAQPES